MSAASAVGATVSARRGRVRRIAGAAAALTAIALTAGCGAGQIAETANEKANIDGIDTSVGSMDLRAVALQSPPDLRAQYASGSSAALKVVFVNNARSDDRLVGIRTTAAGGWAAYRSEAQAFDVLQATNGSASATPAEAPSTASTDASGSGSSSPADSSSDSASSSSSDSTSSSDSSSSDSRSSSESASSASSSAPASTPKALPKGVQSVTIPAGGRIGFGTPEATGGLLLTGLTRTLRPASTVQVVFTFAKAGSVTVPVTVQVADLGHTAVVGGGEGDS